MDTTLAHLAGTRKDCNRVLYGVKNRSGQRSIPARPKLPLRVNEGQVIPVDNGNLRRVEQDPAQADNDGHQAAFNDAVTGASYVLDSQRIGTYVVVLAGAAGLIYLVKRWFPAFKLGLPNS